VAAVLGSQADEDARGRLVVSEGTLNLVVLRRP
jgi:hypothetical protein